MKVQACQSKIFVTSILLLMQVLVEDIIAKSIGINNSQFVTISSIANETQIIVDESEPNLNVTVMVYSHEDYASGNEKSSHINNTFSSDSIFSEFNATHSSASASTDFSSYNSSKIGISYSQLFETSLRPNVNEKLEHKWDNEPNETINTRNTSSFEHNFTLTKLDNGIKPSEDNEREASITVRTPLTDVSVNTENPNKSSTKLGANVELEKRTNESHKAINTKGLVNRNIATTTSSTSYTKDKNQSEYNEDNLEKKMSTSENASQHSSGEQTTHLVIVTKTQSSGDSTTSLPSIDTIYSTISIFSNAPKSAYSTQLVIPAGSTKIEPTEQTTPSGIDHYFDDNSRYSMEYEKNDTNKGLSTITHEETTQAHVLTSMVTKISLPLMTTSQPKTLFNSTDQSNDLQYEDNDSIAPHRRCHFDSLTDVNWTLTEAGVLASQPCPPPYSGTVYRPCYSSGLWGDSDYTECRLEHLREIQSLIFYHVHKHLVDGLYPLAEDLSRLVTSGRFPIKSPMDRLDAIDALNAILRAKIKIRMEEEEKNLNLIQSLMTICDQVLTRTKVVFAIETEKNALITIKTAEALFGFRLLSENILRALIVSCDDGTIRRIKPIIPNSKNIIMTLTHRTPFGSLIPLVTPSNYTTVMKQNQIPRVIIHLEDFNKLGVGISSVWIREIGSTLDNSNFEVVSDIVLVSVVPAVSIEVDFEETPKVEVELQLKGDVKESSDIGCGRIKSARELWLKKGCETIRRNLSSIHCVCNELGIIAALIHKSSSADSSRNKFGRSHSLLVHSFVLNISLTTSLLLLVISLFCQIVQRSRESREASFILINLVTSLSAIQLTFLLGAPFRCHSSLSQQVCNLVPIVLHFIHLVSAFWMLSHTIFLYQRLWRPHESSSELPFSEGDSSRKSQYCWSFLWSMHSLCSFPFCQWGCKQFLLFATAFPAISVLISYFLNPQGYETKRYCWMSIEGGMQYSFIVPVSILIMTNTVIMLLVLKRFFENKPLTHKLEIDKTQPALRAGVTLLPFFAVNWFLSVLALEDTATTAFQYIFSATNIVQCYLVFLFHCYQRYDLHEYFKVRLFGVNNRKSQKSSLRLKKSPAYPGRGLRVDIPRLCIGDERDLITIPITTNSAPIDSQPLLMPCCSSLSSPSLSSPTLTANTSKPTEFQ